jgi:hypothetical protein
VQLTCECHTISHETSLIFRRIAKLRENCGKEYENHWQCLENNNQVCDLRIFNPIGANAQYRTSTAAAKMKEY